MSFLRFGVKRWHVQNCLVVVVVVADIVVVVCARGGGTGGKVGESVGRAEGPPFRER